MSHEEVILSPSNNRFTTFPIKYPELWEMGKSALGSFWTAEEIDLTQDIVDWSNKLNDDERHFISNVLAFFAASDGIVNENLADKFLKEVTIPEARYFYSIQICMESIHGETYSVLIDTLINDEIKKDKLFNAIETIPSVKKKAQWALKWITDQESFAKRLVAFAIVEAIFFSSSFCAIFWLKKRGLMPGLTFSNELISRDEGLHAEFACILYKLLSNKLSENELHEMMDEAINIEMEFCSESLPVHLIGINSDSMKQYVRFCADRLLLSLGYNKKYHDKNPFEWMELISLSGKTNFFERRNADYRKANVGVKAEERVFNLYEDF